MIVRLALLPARVGLKSTALGVKTGYRTGRLLGYRRLAVLGIGVAIGLLIAPVPGRQLRARLRAVLEANGAGGTGDGDLADRVRFELAHHSGTWHLPQPDVAAAGNMVVLSGEVPHATARADIERAAAGVPGVGSVDNRLHVPGTSNGR